jgi:hypothetical protein
MRTLARVLSRLLGRPAADGKQSARSVPLRLVTADGRPAATGLDRLELILFVGGVLLIGFFMAMFLQPLSDPVGLLILVAWLLGGLAYIGWLNRDLAKRSARSRGRRR